MPTLLIVEDDPDQLEIRSLILADAGHQVFGAPTCAEALHLARLHHPALVVMDLRLPRSADGLALIADLRRLVPSPRIVVLSGWTADLSTAPDVDAVLSKPVHTPELIKLPARGRPARPSRSRWQYALTDGHPVGPNGQRREPAR